MFLTERFSDALVYAARVHQNQHRKKTGVPYIGHLLGVADLVLSADGNEDEAIAALLHDAAEDQGGERELGTIRAKFGDRVAEIVHGCSDSLVEEGKKKEEWLPRKSQYHAHLRRTPDPSVRLVSVADKLNNARATLMDVRAYGPEVWDRFTVGKNDQLWNYESLLAIYAADDGDKRIKPLTEELARVITELHSA